MAWTIPTYSGHMMTGSAPNGYRTAVFELCRAVNERQGALGITKTQFTKADGSSASDIATADFIGQFITGTGNDWCANMNAVQAAIVAMLDAEYFTTASGGSTVLTKVAVETSIGTDLDTDIAKPNDTRFLQAQQDALDLMIYGRQRRALQTSAGLNETRRSSLTGHSTADDAWAAMLADTPFSTTGGIFVGYTVFGTSPNFYAIESQKQTALVAAKAGSTSSGTLQGIDWEILPVITGGTTPFDIDVEIGVATLVSDTISGSGSEQYIAGGVGDGDLNNDVTSISFEMTSSAPGTNPMDGTDDTGTVRFRAALIQYFDIAGELTDQA